MYLLLLIITVINLHFSIFSASCSQAMQLQTKCPNVLPNLTRHHTNHKREAMPPPSIEALEISSTQSINPITSNSNGNHNNSRSSNTHIHPHHNQLYSHDKTHKNSTIGLERHDQQLAVRDQLNDAIRQQQVSLNDLTDFRLEYNKYKILSHLSITKNVEDMAPQVDDDLRRELTSLTSSRLQREETASSNSRHKRSLACDQVKGDKNPCCLETFYVNFTHIGWDKWILYPPGYNANYCRGQCDLSHARYYHSTLLSKYSNVISLCCSPKQMAPLRLLYIDEDNKVHQKSIPDMIVEGCDCA